MNNKLCMALGAFALVMLACSSENGSITEPFDDPGAGTAKDNSSSSLEIDVSSSSLNAQSSSSEMESSSSVVESSSSSSHLSLCKVSGDWSEYGCIYTPSHGEGDLWSRLDRKVRTNVYLEDSSKFGDRAGEFFFETDSLEGGESFIEWSDGLHLVPEFDGISLEVAYKIKDIIKDNINIVKSFDLVEYNPDMDIDNKTLDIALNIINDIKK